MSLPKCEICTDDYSSEDGDHTPKSLKCAHSVCTGCARQMLNNCQIVCPVCRELTEVQGNNVANLHKNFALVEAINMMRTLSTKEEKSDNCPCKEHPWNLAEFVCIESLCSSEDKLMCRTCEVVGNHKGHAKELMISKADELRETLKSRLKQMELNKQNFKMETDVIEQAVIDNEKLLNSKLKSMNNHFGQIRQSVNEKEKKLTNDLTTHAKKIRELNNTDKEDMIIWQEQLNELIKLTEERINMNDFELYVAGTELGDEIWYSTDLAKHPPADTTGLDFILPTFKFED